MPESLNARKVVKALSWPELLGSAFLFAAVYLLLYLAYNAATAAAASYFGLDPVLRLRGVSYSNSGLWYPHAVKRTFLVGIVFMAFVAMLSYTLYAMFRKKLIFIRLFMLWASAVSIGMVSQRMVGVLFSGSFEFRKLGDLGMELAVYGAYMYYKPTTYWVIALVGLLLTGVSGFALGKPFLQTAWSSELIGSENNRLVFLRNQIMLPFLIGCGIVVAITFPDNIVPNVLGFACIGLALVFAILRGMLLGPLQIPRQRDWERWPIVPVLVLALVLIGSFTFLKTGIRF
jgi:hypothetical protein